MSKSIVYKLTTKSGRFWEGLFDVLDKRKAKGKFERSEIVSSSLGDGTVIFANDKFVWLDVPGFGSVRAVRVVQSDTFPYTKLLDAYIKYTLDGELNAP